MPRPLLGFGLSRQSALRHHLQYNHYPPVHESWVEPASLAIDTAVAGAFDYGDGSIEIEQEALDTVVSKSGKTVAEVLNGLHLWDFVTEAIANRENESDPYDPDRFKDGE